MIQVHSEKKKSAKESQKKSSIKAKKNPNEDGDFTEFTSDVPDFASLVDLSLFENYFAPEDEHFSASMLSSTEISQFGNLNSFAEETDHSEDVNRDSSTLQFSDSNSFVEEGDQAEDVVINNASTTNSVPL